MSVVASIDKIKNILPNRDHFNPVNVKIVDRPSVAVNIYTLVNNIISFGEEAQAI